MHELGVTDTEIVDDKSCGRVQIQILTLLRGNNMLKIINKQILQTSINFSKVMTTHYFCCMFCYFVFLITRPGVAGAILQTAMIIR